MRDITRGPERRRANQRMTDAVRAEVRAAERATRDSTRFQLAEAGTRPVSFLRFSQPFDLTLPGAGMEDIAQRIRARASGPRAPRRYQGRWIAARGDRLYASTNVSREAMRYAQAAPRLRARMEPLPGRGVRIVGRLRFVSEAIVFWILIATAVAVVGIGASAGNAAIGWFALVPVAVGAIPLTNYVRSRGPERDHLAWRLSEALAAPESAPRPAPSGQGNGRS
ncbi:hypothetical protein [Microbacterium album]|uniref:Uncharacterized protein n=1 Tax=Microbacterium album TaxID=2053191 RepID=A0A917IEW2_9MICO|nr:hypothetical protein [Microbacterium album]GGH42951.1 hypothetical protein GCM10010921_16500 [Microbacterium album]